MTPENPTEAVRESTTVPAGSTGGWIGQSQFGNLARGFSKVRASTVSNLPHVSEGEPRNSDVLPVVWNLRKILTQKIPVIFITVKDEEIDEITGFAVGAEDYITKPITPLIAKARIRTHIALGNQEREKSEKKQKKLQKLKWKLLKNLYGCWV